MNRFLICVSLRFKIFKVVKDFFKVFVVDFYEVKKIDYAVIFIIYTSFCYFSFNCNIAKKLRISDTIIYKLVL